MHTNPSILVLKTSCINNYVVEKIAAGRMMNHACCQSSQFPVPMPLKNKTQIMNL